MPDHIDEIKEARIAATARLQALVREQSQINANISAVRREIMEYDAALKVLAKFDKSASQPVPAPALSIDEPTSESAKLVSQPGVKEALIEVLKETPDTGLKASIIRKRAENRFRMTIDPKSASNSLWRLGQEGKVRRSGYLWYYAKNDAPPATAGGAKLPR